MVTKPDLGRKKKNKRKEGTASIQIEGLTGDDPGLVMEEELEVVELGHIIGEGQFQKEEPIFHCVYEGG